MSPNNICIKTNGTCKLKTYSDLFALDIGFVWLFVSSLLSNFSALLQMSPLLMTGLQI
jgi:hypothetical protein